MPDATAMKRSARHLLAALVLDDRGQDLIEYALATGALSAVAIGAWPAIATAIAAAYGRLDMNTQGLWIPPGPGGGP